jgi:hypothetical protein
MVRTLEESPTSKRRYWLYAAARRKIADVIVTQDALNVNAHENAVLISLQRN